MALPPRRSGSARPASGRTRAARPGAPRSSSNRSRPRPAAGAQDADSAGPNHGERLQKLLAAAGLGSRRACEELILTGRVEVDRQTVSAIGTRVDPLTQEIRVDGEPLPQPRLTYVMVHKIQGILSTASDPSGRPRVTDMVPPEFGRLFPVGRLDMSSEGLILLTNDGELANQLTHPRYGIEKMYHVQVAGQIQQETLDELEKGVYLAEGVAKVVGVTIKSHHKNSTILEMVLDEGRNREIRRLLARVGHKVQRLTRVAMGPLKLGDVPPGAYRPLRHDEISALQECVQEVPVGKRAYKRPGQPRSGSRKLLRERKPGGAANRSSSNTARPAANTEAKSSPGRFGSAEMSGSGTRFSRKPSRAKSAAATPLPKPRTVIGDDLPFEMPSETVRSKPAADKPAFNQTGGSTYGSGTKSGSGSKSSGYKGSRGAAEGERSSTARPGGRKFTKGARPTSRPSSGRSQHSSDESGDFGDSQTGSEQTKVRPARAKLLYGKSGTPKPGAAKSGAGKPFGTKSRTARPSTGSSKPAGKFRNSKSSDSSGEGDSGKPAYDKPAYGKSSGAKSSYGKSTGAKSGYGKSTADKPAGAKVGGGKPAGAKASVRAKSKGKPAFRQGRSAGK